MTIVLKKDLIIPAGTIFTDAPKTIVYVGKGHISTVLALGNDSHGTFTYDIGENSEYIEDVFEIIKGD